MRVRFIKTFSTARQVFRGGREYDVDNAEAAECIGQRIAEEVKPAAKLAKVGQRGSQTRRD